MVQRICDRCGKVMKGPENDGVSHVNGCVIVRAKGGDVRQSWEFLDLCDDCRKSFGDWLEMTGSALDTDPID